MCGGGRWEGKNGRKGKSRQGAKSLKDRKERKRLEWENHRLMRESTKERKGEEMVEVHHHDSDVDDEEPQLRLGSQGEEGTARVFQEGVSGERADLNIEGEDRDVQDGNIQIPRGTSPRGICMFGNIQIPRGIREHTDSSRNFWYGSSC